VLLLDSGLVGVDAAGVAEEGGVELVVEADDGKHDGAKSWKRDFNASRGEGVGAPDDLDDSRVSGGDEVAKAELDGLVERLVDRLGVVGEFETQKLEDVVKEDEGGLVVVLAGQTGGEVLDGLGMPVDDLSEGTEMFDTLLDV
jgi:hypothetical protein